MAKLSCFILYLSFLFIIPTNACSNSKETLRQAMADKFLRIHNKIRTMRDLPPYEWDKDLAKVADEWSKRLAISCSVYPSKSGYGENIYQAWQIAPTTPTEALRTWLRTYDSWNRKCRDGEECSEYFNLVSLKTKRVGCGYSICYDFSGSRSMIYVCNYDPKDDW